MEQWTKEFLDRVLVDGEIEISNQLKCLFTRSSLSIIEGVSIYNLPSDMIDLHRVTWLGIKLESWNPNEFSSNIMPHSNATSSKPQFYILNPYNYNEIRFYPTPSESIAQLSTANLTLGEGIRAGVCLSYTALADGVTKRVPEWLRSALLGYYQNYRKYSLAGKLQSLETAEFYKSLFTYYLGLFKQIVDEVPGAVKHRMRQNFGTDINNGRPARPVLPSNYGRR